MDHKIGVRVLMTAGGVVTALIGCGHIFMPEFGYNNLVQQSMESSVREHFYYLGTYAICLFLLVFSALSIFFSKFTYPKATAVISAAMFIFWGPRAVLEMIYPVNVKIFFLDNPHILLMPIISVLTIVYLVSTIKSWYLIGSA